MKYDELVIEAGKPGKPTTSLDCKYFLNGDEETVHRLKRLKWVVDPGNSVITITTKDGKHITTKSKIKRMAVYTKYFTIVTDNTPRGTIIFNRGKNITQDLGAVSIVYIASKPGSVNELEIIVC